MEPINQRTKAIGFIPDFCRIQVVFAVVVSAELLAMILVLGADRQIDSFWNDLSLVSLYVQWIALGTAGFLCLFKAGLQRLPNGVAAGCAWLILMVVAALVSEVVYRFMGPVMLEIGGRFDLLFRSLAISALVGILLLHYFHLQYRWRTQLIAEGEARLQALQSRIRPHFLFNSMNTIASLTRSQPEVAEEITQDLADLFRVSLGDASRDSTLEQEISLARGYLNIEQQRLGDRLTVEWDLEDLPQNAVLPPLMLQPLLENAVYHGIEPSLEPGVIHIAGRYTRGKVNLSIRNTVPADGTKKQRPGNQMALDNIRQRLVGMFEQSASLVESTVDNQYQVRMVFPHPLKSS